MSTLSIPTANLSSKPQQHKIIQDVEECVKSLVEIFQEQKSPINDDNQTLQRFCAKLEHLLQMDMKDKYTLLGRKKDYWDYFCDCLSSNKGSNDGIKFVKSVGEHKTSVGKGRALIRFSLVHHRLPDTIQQCVINGKVTSDYYQSSSVWLRKDKSSSIIGCLYDLNDVNFDLSSRGYDLDSTWPSFAKKSGSFNWNPPSRRSSISSMTSVQTMDNTSVLNMSIPTFDTAEVDRLNNDLAYSETVKSELLGQVESLQEKKMLSDQSAWVTQGELSVVQDQLHNNLEKLENMQERYHDLEKRYDDVIKTKSQLESDIKTKTCAMDELTEKLNSVKLKSEEDIDRYQEQLSNSKSEITELETSYRNKIQNIEQSKSDLSVELKSCQKELQTEKDLLMKKNEDNAMLEKKLSSTEDHNQQLLKKLESVFDEKGSEASASLEAASKLGDMLDSLKQTQTENTELKGRTAQLEIQLTNLEEKYADVTSQKENLKTQLESLITEKNAMEISKNGEIEDLNKKNSDVQSQLKHTEELLSQKSCDLNTSQDTHVSALKDLKNCFSDVPEFDTFDPGDSNFNTQTFIETVQSFKNKIVNNQKTLQSEVTSLKEENADILSSSEKSLQELNKELEQLKSVTSTSEADLKDEIEKQNVIIAELRASVDQSDINIEKYKLSLHTQDETIVQLYQSLTIQNLNSENCDTNLLLNKIGEEYQNLSSNLTKLNSQNKDLSEKLEFLESGETDKDGKLNELLTQITELETQHSKEMTERENKMQTLKKNNTHYQEGLARKEDELSTLMKESESLRHELTESKEKFNMLSVQKSQLENSVQLNREQLQQTSSEKSEIINRSKDLETQIDILNSEIESKSSDLQTFKSKVDNFSKEIDNLKTTNDKLQKLNSVYENKLQCMEEKVTELEEEVETEKSLNLNFQIGRKDSQAKEMELSQEIDNQKQSYSELKERCEKYESERDALNVRLDEVFKDTQVIKEQLNQTSANLVETSSDKEKIDKEIGVTKEEILKKMQEIDALKQENEELKHELDAIESEKEHEHKEKDLVKDELDGLKTELSDSENQIQKLTEDSFSLTARIELITQQFENQGQELRTVESRKLELESELSEIKLNFETLSSDNTDHEHKITELNSEIEKLEKEQNELNSKSSEFVKTGEELVLLKSQVETQTQEISALQFQLSSEQLQHEQIMTSYRDQSKNQSDLQVQVVEQEKLLESLVKQLNEIKSSTTEEVTQRESQVEMIRRELQQKGEELNLANQRFAMTSDQLEQERVERFQLQGELDALSTTVCHGSTEKDQIIYTLRSDIKLMKKKLIKVVRDKDALWQMTDQLTDEKKQQAGEVWMDNSTVANCLGCKAEFSLFVRRHHCRSCGKIYCYNCCNNWIMMAHSSKKERVCNTCNSRQELLDKNSMNSSVLSNNLDSDEENELIQSLPIPESTSSHDQSFVDSPDDVSSTGLNISLDNNPSDISQHSLQEHSPSPDNITIESKESKDSNFHVITTEEISRSVSITESDLMASSICVDSSMSSGVVLLAEDIEREEVNCQNDTIVKPGKSYVVPIKIETPDTTLYWQFTSKPKDIVFSVKYTPNESPLDTDVLVEPCKCNSHIKPVDGELVAKQPGLYSLIFDNTYSKLTSKTVHYTLRCKT